VRNWSGFREGTDEAILSLHDVMSIMSTPRHSARLKGNYVSSSQEYVPMFLKKLKEVTGGTAFWNPEGD